MSVTGIDNSAPKPLTSAHEYAIGDRPGQKAGGGGRVAGLDQLYREAIRAHQQGKAREAGRLYDSVLAKKPDHAGALHLKGVLALQAHDYDTAAHLIERSLRIEPRHGLALSNLGVTYRALRRYDDAVAALRKAVTIEPNSA